MKKASCPRVVYCGTEDVLFKRLSRYSDDFVLEAKNHNFRGSILCTDVISQAPSTTLSHKSILYSLYPSIHKTSMLVLPKETVPSPLEILQTKGFKTAAFVGGGQLSKKFGFSKGFDSYWEPSGEIERNTKLVEMKPLAFEWLEKNHSQKFFLFLHTYQVHCPYFPPEEFRLKYASWYKGGIDRSPEFYSGLRG